MTLVAKEFIWCCSFFQVYLVTESNVMYITEDGGETFQSIKIPVQIADELIFHPSKHFKDYILAKNAARVRWFLN